MPAYDRGFSAYKPDAFAPREDVSERRSTELAGLGPTARPVVADAWMFVPTSVALVALDLDSGRSSGGTVRNSLGQGPVILDGFAYVGFADQRGLVALDVRTGEEQWRTETRGAMEASPTFDYGHDHLYVGDDTDRIYRTDPANGEITLRGEVFGPVTALAHGRTLLVGTESGEVYSLFSHHGEFTGL